METPTKHEPVDFGVPYFKAIVRNGREYGVCPRCGEEVKRTKGAFGRHWEDAVKFEAVAK